MDLTPEQLVDEDRRRSGFSNRSNRSSEAKGGRQVWRYTFPPQEYDLGRPDVYDPSRKQAAPRRLAVHVEGR